MLMNIFLNHIRCNIEVYINDMVLKTLEEESKCRALGSILNLVRKYNMHLNLGNVHSVSKNDNCWDLCSPKEEYKPILKSVWLLLIWGAWP